MTFTQRTDHDLKTAVIDEIAWVPSVNSDHIGVAVTGGVVTLSGRVDSYPERYRAEQAALGVRGVTAVAEEITVAGTPESSDTTIAREANRPLAQAIDVPAGSVQVLVKNNILTLNGSIPSSPPRLPTWRTSTPRRTRLRCPPSCSAARSSLLGRGVCGSGRERVDRPVADRRDPPSPSASTPVLASLCLPGARSSGRRTDGLTRGPSDAAEAVAPGDARGRGSVATVVQLRRLRGRARGGAPGGGPPPSRRRGPAMVHGPRNRAPAATSSSSEGDRRGTWGRTTPE